MAESEDGQEKSEEATGKKLQDARTKGQVPRSREFSAFLVLMVAGACFYYSSTWIVVAFKAVLSSNLMISRDVIFDQSLGVDHLYNSIYEVAGALFPFLLALFIAAFVSQLVIGGWNFTFQALEPQLSRLDPIKGIKTKILSMNSVMELVKSLAKFFLVSGFAMFILDYYTDEIMILGQLPVEVAIDKSLAILMMSFIFLSSSLFIVVMLDIPFQLWNHSKQLKMTKQEVRDEMKNTEGKPEVKGRIRQLQREFAQRRMMENVPKADVVITNPTHFSVALKYDQSKNGAPVLIAKATDLLALKIREIANKHEIVIVTAPPLARSIYYTTEIDHEIPEGLYVAVAQVLAYVYQVKQHSSGKGPRPRKMPDIDVPDGLRYD